MLFRSAIPLGILPGLAVGVQMIRVSARYSVSSDPALAEQMKWIAESGEVNLIRPWIIGFGILISLATVSISLQKPMRTAAGISAIEALRYQGNEHNAAAARKRISRLWHRRRKPAQTSGKCRKGYEEINTRKLTITNLTRNKKRTVMTIFTLGATGILFMVVAALCSCMDPEEIGRAHV